MKTLKFVLVTSANLLLLSACGNNQFGNTPPLGTNTSPGISWNANQVQPFTPLQLDDNALTMLGQWERQELGVAPSNGLYAGAMHAPTPANIQGAQIVTTRELAQLISQTAAGSLLILDVLGGPQRIPGAQMAVPASQGGDFDDQTQKQFGEYLQSATQGNRAMPIITYCQNRECWMSYNAALRAVALGYSNVMWYRGGIQAWMLAGRPVEGGPYGAQTTPVAAADESVWQKLLKPIGALKN